jgi:DNA-directed RNA polymerase subunit K/omega
MLDDEMLDVKENENLKNLSIALRSLSELLLGIQDNNQYTQEEMQCIAQKCIK